MSGTDQLFGVCALLVSESLGEAVVLIGQDPCLGRKLTLAITEAALPAGLSELLYHEDLPLLAGGPRSSCRTAKGQLGLTFPIHSRNAQGVHEPGNPAGRAARAKDAANTP
jgi:hypothetical protein